MSEEEIKELRFKRGIFKGQLTRFVTFLSSQENKQNLNQLEVRSNKLESVFKDFDEIQTRLEYLDPSEEKERVLENLFYDTLATAKDCIQKIKTETNRNLNLEHSGNNSASQAVVESSIRLPPLNLPHFSGNYEAYIAFRDGFLSLVHNNSSLTNVQKLHYLRSCLKNEAFQLIEALKITDDNYSIAWDLIKKRYDNKRIIINNHVKSLFDLPTVTKDSHVLMRQLIDKVFQHTNSLKLLEIETDTWDIMLIHLICSKLDYTTNREWESSLQGDSLPTLNQFLDFLSKKCFVLETLQNNKDPQNSRFNQNKYGTNKFKSIKPAEQSFVATEDVVCPHCNANHFIFNCDTFMKLPIREKYFNIRKMRLCTNCLRKGHNKFECRSRGCKTCSLKHNSLLHDNNFYATNANNSANNIGTASNVSQDTTNSNSTENVNKSNDARAEQVAASKVTAHTHAKNDSQPSQVLLSTAEVFISDRQGNWHTCTILLDSGSQSSFITQTLYDKLKLTGEDISVPITGINQNILTIRKKTQATIKSRINNYTATIQLLILPKITDKLPSRDFEKTSLEYPKELPLADTNFNKSKEVDILLGASIFYDLLCIGQIHLGKNMLTLQKTKFGWIFSGNLILNKREENNSVCNFARKISNEDLHDSLTKFWDVEEIPRRVILSPEDQFCEEYFETTTIRDSDGRFIVRLPFSENSAMLGNSKERAQKRYQSLEFRLNRDENLQHDYVNFMRQYEEMNHMSLCSTTDNENVYYLPHHPVIKPSSTTTKCRVVFDASAKTTTGISLNDKLLAGPVVQDDLFSIVLRLRLRRYVLSADIKMMFRMILIHPDDRSYQQILWRYNEEQAIQSYQLNTITYGTTCAPFLATRCLIELAEEYKQKYYETCQIIKNSFYMDDLLVSMDTIEEIIETQRQLTEILASANFELRKYSSNDREILNIISSNNVNNEPPDNLIKFNDQKDLKTLGLSWNSVSDTLQYAINIKFDRDKITKRTILSVISQIYDPLGLIGPTIIIAKILVQQLWQLQVDWDESIPINLHTTWFKFLKEIDSLNHLAIKRQVLCNNPTSIELHGFCDSSERAYGAAIYLKSTDAQGNVYTRLFCAKSRVTPLKPVTIPRLELLAAVLLVQLSRKVFKAIHLKMSRCFYYCDSKIVLSWLRIHPSQLKQFVANRVQRITELTDVKDWYHVSSENNAADIISRGINPEVLVNLDVWWYGPKFIQNKSVVTRSEYLEDKDNLPDIKQSNATITLFTKNTYFDIFNKYSTLQKLMRITAYCIRFKNIALKQHSHKSRLLTAEELDHSLSMLIKLSQQEEFASEIHSLKTSTPLKRNSKLLNLHPFLDNQGLLRVGGRLVHSNLSYDEKHQIILPNKHTLTRLIITDMHVKNLHAGTQSLLYAVRVKYWPMNGKNLIKGIIHKCIRCFRTKPKQTQFLMGNLPSSRVTPCRPFLRTGIDYAGPIFIKASSLRRSKLLKTYICLFVCFTTHAVHIELVGDLTTDSFLNALKRFISRRGKPTDIYTDNGSNFIGASNHFEDLYKLLSHVKHQERVSTFLTQDKINWNFIPAHAPHMGGLWEAAIRLCKFHLKRIVGNASLTFEEMSTLLVQIEACLNSRPLSPLSDDPKDYLPLTPAHFLIGHSLLATPQLDVQENNYNRLNRYHRLQQLLQHFWQRWSQEYLNGLQQRSKWQAPRSSKVNIGSLVILKDDHRPPLCWPLARITALHPGTDNIVRVVSVKVPSGSVYRRSLTKVCVLPIDEVDHD